MKRSCDVLVVGAGPAGATAARFAAEQGARVALIDRAAFPRDKTCGGLVTRRALTELGMPVPAALVEAEPRGLRLVDTTGREVLARDQNSVGAIVNRREFDAHLVERATAAGAEFFPGTMIGCLGHRPDGSIEIETPNDRWQCAYVIGADGAFSTTGLLAGLSTGWSEWEEGFGLTLDIPTDVPAHELTGGAIEFHLQPVLCGLGWVYPRHDGLSVGMAATSIERSAMTLQFERFLRFLRDRYHLVLPNARPRSWYLPVAVRRRRFARGRVLLAGDAAGLIDPMSADGIYAALVSGRLAARAAVAGLRNPAVPTGAVAHAYTAWIARDLQRDQRAATTLSFLLGRKGDFLFDVIRANPALAGKYLAALGTGNCWPAVLRDALRLWPFYCLATLAAGRHRRREEAVVFERP